MTKFVKNAINDNSYSKLIKNVQRDSEASFLYNVLNNVLFEIHNK